MAEIRYYFDVSSASKTTYPKPIFFVCQLCAIFQINSFSDVSHGPEKKEKIYKERNLKSRNDTLFGEKYASNSQLHFVASRTYYSESNKLKTDGYLYY